MFNRINTIPYLRAFLVGKVQVLKKHDITEKQLLILIELNFHYRINHRVMKKLRGATSAQYYILSKKNLEERGYILGLESVKRGVKGKERTFTQSDIIITQKGKDLLQNINQDFAEVYNSLAFDKTTFPKRG